MNIERLNKWKKQLVDKVRSEKTLNKATQINSLLKLLDESLTPIGNVELNLKFKTISNGRFEQGYAKPFSTRELRDIVTLIDSVLSNTSHLKATNTIIKNKLPSNHLLLNAEYFVVVDMEMTAPPLNVKGFKSETIEFGIVVLDKNLSIINEFETLVKPTLNPNLSVVTSKITGISQSMIDSSDTFPTVHEKLMSFLLPYTKNGLIVQWGKGDSRQLNMDCKLHGLNSPNIRVCNLQDVFKITGLAPSGIMKLSKVIEHLGLKVHSKSHRALSDAHDTSMVLKATLNEIS
ncbi:hypothetical protein VCHA53O466_40096 [Vibrio chagasii]|nr:hypothetical protein VCHA53O466_40096 [Vibrio chagasii]